MYFLPIFHYVQSNQNESFQSYLFSIQTDTKVNSAISNSPSLQSIRNGVFHYVSTFITEVILKDSAVFSKYSTSRYSKYALSSTILKDFILLTVSPFLLGHNSPFLLGHWPNSQGWICIINRVNGSIYLFVLSDFSVNLSEKEEVISKS